MKTDRLESTLVSLGLFISSNVGLLLMVALVIYVMIGAIS